MRQYEKEYVEKLESTLKEYKSLAHSMCAAITGTVGCKGCHNDKNDNCDLTNLERTADYVLNDFLKENANRVSVGDMYLYADREHHKVQFVMITGGHDGFSYPVRVTANILNTDDYVTIYDSMGLYRFGEYDEAYEDCLKDEVRAVK